MTALIAPGAAITDHIKAMADRVQQAVPIIGLLSGVSPSFSGRRRTRRDRRG
jgi:hypothetical protein